MSDKTKYDGKLKERPFSTRPKAPSPIISKS